MNLDKVLGIIVDEDGVAHSFGESKEKIAKELEDKNFHDRAFDQEVLNSEWFKLTGYNYDTSHNVVYNAFDMANNGFCILINDCSKLANGTEYNLFAAYVNENMTEEQRDYLESIYGDFKKIIEDRNSLFYGFVYDDESELDEEPLYDIDDFYERLNLNTFTL